MRRTLSVAVAVVAFVIPGFAGAVAEAQRGERGRPGGPGPGGRGPAGPPQITQVVGDLYKVSTGPGVQPVTVFLVTREGILLADPENTQVAMFLKEEFARRFKVPVRYVIYSHYHWDHSRGGAVFADTAKFVAHEKTAEMLKAPFSVAHRHSFPVRYLRCQQGRLPDAGRDQRGDSPP